MFKNLLFLFAFSFSILFVLYISIVSANDSENVVPETTTCTGQELQLNGWGTRKKLFIKLYVASLYVQKKINDADQFLEMEQASCIRMQITSSKITSEKMIKATREGFEKSTKGNTAPIESEIEKFFSWLKQPIKKDDVLEFSFSPHNTTHVIKNDQELGVIENKQFAAALFGIWLGEMPAQENLRDELLGQLHTL